MFEPPPEYEYMCSRHPSLGWGRFSQLMHHYGRYHRVHQPEAFIRAKGEPLGWNRRVYRAILDEVCQ